MSDSDKKTKCFKALGFDGHQWDVFSLTYDTLQTENKRLRERLAQLRAWVYLHDEGLLAEFDAKMPKEQP